MNSSIHGSTMDINRIKAPVLLDENVRPHTFGENARGRTLMSTFLERFKDSR